jgi:hypothetical protein
MKRAFIAKLTLAALVALTGNAIAQETETETSVIDQVAEVVKTADTQASVSDVPVSTEGEVLPVTEGEIISPPMSTYSDVVYDSAPMMSSPGLDYGQVVTPMVSNCGSCCGQTGYTSSVPYASPVNDESTVNSASPVSYATPTFNNDCNSSCVGQVAYQEPIVQAATTPVSIVEGGVTVNQAPIITSNAIISSPANTIQASTPITYGTPTTPITYGTPITTAPTAGCSSCDGGAASVGQPVYSNVSMVGGSSYAPTTMYAPATTYSASCNNCSNTTSFRSRPLMRRAARGVGFGLLRNRN